MTFLELCQRVRQEAGISGTGPLSTVSQSGEMRRVVDWTKTAWIDVQNEQTEWNFLQAPFSLTCVPGTSTYTAADATVTDLRAWDMHSMRVRLNVPDQTELEPLDYRTFYDHFLLGTEQSGRPLYITATPSDSLQVSPNPNAAFIISGWYRKSPVAFTADADVPAIGSEYHMIIVYRALMMYARYSAAPEVFDDAANNYRMLLAKMRRRYLPEMGESEPLV